MDEGAPKAASRVAGSCLECGAAEVRQDTGQAFESCFSLSLFVQ
jgi:hypothetical protein